jgi:hypothetical protein
VARSLPENTVDAWTAMHLSACGASWIWLPTTNQGATYGGSHPGDIGALLGRRLVIIENKAIEAQREIDFGQNGASQREMLELVEDAGLERIPVEDYPPLGWVFFGLPFTTGAVDGFSWRSFPTWHRLTCPHALEIAGVGSKLRLDELPPVIVTHCPCCGVRAAEPPEHTSLPLDWLAHSCTVGLAGLPLASEEGQLYDQLGGLVAAAQEAMASRYPDVEPALRTNRDLVSELLVELAGVLGASGSTQVVAVL